MAKFLEVGRGIPRLLITAQHRDREQEQGEEREYGEDAKDTPSVPVAVPEHGLGHDGLGGWGEEVDGVLQQMLGACPFALSDGVYVAPC